MGDAQAPAFWYDGVLHQGKVELAVTEPGLLFGASVFTTLRGYGGSLESGLTGWTRHCDRITQSLRAFDWTEPNWSHIRTGCDTLKQHYPVLRITVFADGCELITGRGLPANLAIEQAQGVTLWLSDNSLHHRSQPQHKTGNYLGCYLAMQQAKAHRARDAILINASGSWLETSTGSLWGYKDGHWWTPPLSAGILPGIQRAWLLKQLTALGQHIIQQPWTPDLPPQFDALFYTNCVIEYLPVHTVLTGQTKLEYDRNSPAGEALRGLLATARLEL
ncbi:MAG: aminotransferase class IV [Cyanobacteria bacterium P01_A01_bin.105]